MKSPWLHFVLVAITQDGQTDTLLPLLSERVTLYVTGSHKRGPKLDFITCLAKDEINVPIALSAFRDKHTSVSLMKAYTYSPADRTVTSGLSHDMYFVILAPTTQKCN